MSGRRSHPRYAVATPWEGAMRVLRDVVVSRADGNEVHAVSQVAAVVGEEMTLDVMGAGAAMNFRVRVIESRPLMVQGVVRHQVKLAMVGSNGEAPVGQPQVTVEAASPMLGALTPAALEAI